jgi:segregation and condensation protein B
VLQQLITGNTAEVAEQAPRDAKAEKAEIKAALRRSIDEISEQYADEARGMEIRHVAGGYRMSTKAEHHDVVRSFAKNLKSPIRLSLPALETLAVIAYKQPVTAPEISEIRGVDSSGVLATLIDRKLITTAGRKAVVGRPILYKTTKDFLLRFGLKDVNELPSMEEFEKMTQDHGQENLFDNSPVPDATGVSHESAESEAEESPNEGADLSEAADNS